MWIWRRTERVKWTDKECSCARKSGRRKNNAGTDKEEENKLAWPLAKNELLKDALEGMVNGKKVRGRRRYQLIDNIMVNGLYEDMKRKAEKTVEWRMLSSQSVKDLLLGSTL